MPPASKQLAFSPTNVTSLLRRPFQRTSGMRQHQNDARLTLLLTYPA